MRHCATSSLVEFLLFFLCSMAEERLYTRTRGPDAEVGSWRSTNNGGALSYETIIRCPKCQHGCIMKPWNMHAADDVPPRLHCRGCGYYHVFRYDRQDYKELYSTLTCVVVGSCAS
jgi:hypothetical protein